MTPSEAATRLRATLDGSAIVAATLGQPAGEWVPVRRADLQLVVDAVAVLPMGVLEAEIKRAERAEGTGDGARSVTPEGSSELTALPASEPPLIPASYPYRAPHSVFGDLTPPRPQDRLEAEERER